MIRAFRFLNLVSIFLGYTACLPANASERPYDRHARALAQSLDQDDPSVLLASVAYASPDTFRDRDNDPDNVLSMLCADDEPNIEPVFIPSLDKLCAGYLVLQPERRLFLVVTRQYLFPVAIGYSLGHSDGYVSPIMGVPRPYSR